VVRLRAPGPAPLRHRAAAARRGRSRPATCPVTAQPYRGEGTASGQAPVTACTGSRTSRGRSPSNPRATPTASTRLAGRSSALVAGAAAPSSARCAWT
jgi:hypothetical protein